MDGVYLPLFSALAGAIIGSATSVATMIVQARATARRERTRLAVEAGIEDQRNLVAYAKSQQRPVSVTPLSAAILYHADLLETLERGRVTPEILSELYGRQEKLRAIIIQASDDRKAKAREHQ